MIFIALKLLLLFVHFELVFFRRRISRMSNALPKMRFDWLEKMYALNSSPDFPGIWKSRECLCDERRSDHGKI